MTLPKYKCSQDELYEVCRAGWQSYLDEIASFTPLKALYTVALATTRNTAIDAAEVLPDDQARGADHEVKRVGLRNQATTCLNLWLQLDRYIDTAYTDKTIRKARREEAGSGDYAEAANGNWEKLKSLLLSGKNFISAHTAELTAGGNMPAGFSATYNAARTAFLPLLTAFINSEQGTKTGTEAKVVANNAIYGDLINMFQDGSFLFKSNPDKKPKFSFNAVLGLVSSPGVAGLHVLVSEVVSFNPLANASVSMQQAGLPAVVLQTGVDGVCDFGSLAVGDYTLSVSLPTYVSQNIPVVIKVGVHSRRRVTLAH